MNVVPNWHDTKGHAVPFTQGLRGQLQTSLFARVLAARYVCSM
ncbi:hypothetical protein Bra471DRAFT_04257 [Bradyrhizobium sp. WSM471]|nr:hypothetical protein Bra471DRAFT_04257 [Bradyrhizobium sp. WSM471]